MKKLILAATAVCTSLVLFAGRPVARWDVVPYQRITGTFNAGVVAFHEKVLKVAFTINGQPARTVEAPEFNPRTKVWEYVLPIEAAKFPDGELKLGAEVTAAGEAGTVLPELVLYADSGKTQGSHKFAWVDPVNGNEFDDGSREHPVKSIHQGIQKAGDGGRVLLLPGVYQSKLAGGGKNRRFWTAVTPAPGVSRDQVKIAGGRPGTEKIRWRNVELFCDCSEGYDAIIMGEGGDTMAWFENCRFTNKAGRYGGQTSPFGNRLRAFVTGGETEEMGNGPCCEFVRGHVVKSIASDAFSYNDCLVVNSTVEGIDPGSTSADPDVFNGFATGSDWIHDVIMYNVKATGVKAKGLAGQRLRDSAFVNVLIENDGGDLVYSRFSEAMENVLFAHLTLIDQKWQWMQTKNGRGDFKPNDVRFVNCVFREMEGYDLANGGLTIGNCAFYNKDFYGRTTTLGENAVTIGRDFVGEAAKRFALVESSAGAKGGVDLPAVPADANGEKFPAGARPCGAFAK